jgi:mono/diheme cytochrome c family protein
VVDEGRSLFNQYCAHCHGTNAYQGERSRDLRRLKLRYQAQASRIFYETVSNGRMEKGHAGVEVRPQRRSRMANLHLPGNGADAAMIR